MNMKRIVFVAVGILIMLVIMGFTLHSMRNIDEINQKRREQDKGEAIASRMVVTTATTSIWDSLRATETETETGSSGEIPQESGNMTEITADGESVDMTQELSAPETDLQNQEVIQTVTETVGNQVLIVP